MLRSTLLSLALLAGMTAGANAASFRLPVAGVDNAVVQVGEGCGANR